MRKSVWVLGGDGEGVQRGRELQRPVSTEPKESREEMATVVRSSSRTRAGPCGRLCRCFATFPSNFVLRCICIEQGLLTKTDPAHQRVAVESVHFPLWTYNPATGKLKLDSAACALLGYVGPRPRSGTSPTRSRSRRTRSRRWGNTPRRLYGFSESQWPHTPHFMARCQWETSDIGRGQGDRP